MTAHLHPEQSPRTKIERSTAKRYKPADPEEALRIRYSTVSQSGTVHRSGRISRAGNSMTRMHLVSAAKSMMQQADKDSDLRRWAMNIAERSGRGKARVALARKLSTVMLAMWKSGEPFKSERLGA